jgi:hypothetical protein
MYGNIVSRQIIQRTSLKFNVMFYAINIRNRRAKELVNIFMKAFWRTRTFHIHEYIKQMHVKDVNLKL